MFPYRLESQQEHKNRYLHYWSRMLKSVHQLDAAIATRWLLCDMFQGYNFPIRAIIDNKDTYDSVHSSTNVTEKQLRREVGMIKESLRTGELSRLVWLRGEYQLSDSLTKNGADTVKLRQVIQSGMLSREQLNAAS